MGGTESVEVDNQRYWRHWCWCLISSGLQQVPSFPGRQFSQDFPAFTQAHREQEPDLLHLQQPCSRRFVNRLVSPPKNEPVRMRTSICGRGQRAFQNRYIFRPDDAREERKVRHYSVLQLNANVRKFSETTPRSRLFTHPFSSGS